MVAKRKKPEGKTAKKKKYKQRKPRPAPSGTTKFIVPEAAYYLRLSVSTLNKLRCEGGGPPYCKAGRTIIYDQPDLDAWLKAGKHTSTSDYPAVKKVEAEKASAT
jgi:hypothetical protein